MHRLGSAVAFGLAAGALAAPLAAGQQQDLRSPDSRDAAAGRAAAGAPEVTVVKVADPSPSSGGIDWGDAGIGAASLLGLSLVGVGGALTIAHHRRLASARARPSGGTTAHNSRGAKP
jgi:hypothetical protein